MKIGIRSLIKMPIFIDTRGEGEKELYHLLRNKHLAVEYKHIDSGDIVFGNDVGGYVGIERKTIADLVNSVRGQNRHFWDQLKVLKNTYKTPLVIIEGRIDYKDKLVSGILFSLTFGWKLQWIGTYNIYDTAEAITRLFTKFGVNKASGYPPAAVRKEDTPAKIQWAMIQCVRGIGPSSATKILKLVDVCQLATTDPEWLAKQVKGLGLKSTSKLVSAFQYGTH